MIIDGENLVLGRLASIAAKKALLGDDVTVVNCNKIIITGNKKQILGKFVRKVQMGGPFKGPFIHRSATRIALRTIKNMLPYKQEKGKQALKRIKCYSGVPSDVKIEEAAKIEGISTEKLPNLRYVQLGKIAELIGGKK